MMSHHEDEINELIVYISGLRRTFNRKLDDHLFIIESQRERIDYQQHLIDEQRSVVDELAWQIRDLRDSVRQCCEKVTDFEENQCRHCLTNKMDRNVTNKSARGQIVRQHHVLEDEAKSMEAVYETVDNFTSREKPMAAERTKRPGLERQSAVDQGASLRTLSSDNRTSERSTNPEEDKRKTRYIRPAPTFPPPPPPVNSPPRSLNTPFRNVTAENKAFTNSPLANSPLRNSPNPNMSLLYSNSPPSNLPFPNNRLPNSPLPNTPLPNSPIPNSPHTNTPPAGLVRQENIDVRDSIDDYNDELGDIILRLRQFKDFSTRSNRGSSKNVCSLISDIEGDYLPRDEELDEIPQSEISRQNNRDVARAKSPAPDTST